MNKKRDIGHAFSEHVFLTKKTYHKTNSDDDGGLDLMRKLPIMIFGLIFVIFTLRLLTLQVVRGEYYDRLSNENRIRTTLIPAPRGVIYDRNGEPLVLNTPTFSIIKDGEIEWLTQEQALKLLEDDKNLVVSIPQREYLYEGTFSHVLGYIGKLSEEETLQQEFTGYGFSDFTGRMGIEEEYERLLHGENGRRLIEVDAQGKYIRTLGEDFSVPGKNITTTLDLDIQKSVFDAMSDVDTGAAVVSDPRNGAILGIVSKPTFDPNLFTKSENYEPDGGFQSVEDILVEEKQPLLNRVIAGLYAPGSTFKIVTATAGLEEDAINPNALIEDTGVRTIGGTTFGTWYYLQYGRKEAPLNLVGAIRRSNDIYFYVLSESIGAKKLSEWAGRFGFGKLLNIDIPGEVAGSVPGPSWKERVMGDDWYLGDTYNMSIGQGFLQTTPLQVNTMTNVVANGGKLYRPHILSENMKVVREDFIDKTNLDLVSQGMLEACQPGGTGYPFFDFRVKNPNLKIDSLDVTETASASAGTVNISIGCKTGTSETFDDSDPHAWFTIFAPYHNPEISVTVLVEHGGEGSAVAAPIAKEILTKYFENKKK